MTRRAAATRGAASSRGRPARRSAISPGAAFGNPDPTSVPGGSNSVAVLSAGWPASGLLATAAGLAGFYRLLLAGHIISPATLRSALTPRATGAGPGTGGECCVWPGFHAPLGSVLGSGGRPGRALSGIAGSAARPASATRRAAWLSGT